MLPQSHMHPLLVLTQRAGLRVQPLSLTHSTLNLHISQIRQYMHLATDPGWAQKSPPLVPWENRSQDRRGWIYYQGQGLWRAGEESERSYADNKLGGRKEIASTKPNHLHEKQWARIHCIKHLSQEEGVWSSMWGCYHSQKSYPAQENCLTDYDKVGGFRPNVDSGTI